MSATASARAARKASGSVIDRRAAPSKYARWEIWSRMVQPAAGVGRSQSPGARAMGVFVGEAVDRAQHGRAERRIDVDGVLVAPDVEAAADPVDDELDRLGSGFEHRHRQLLTVARSPGGVP